MSIPRPELARGRGLYLEGVTVSFDGFKALDRLSLAVEPGELRCIIGPNGAGKTTMMDVITGKTRPDSGSAWFGQTLDLLSLNEPEIARSGIGRKFCVLGGENALQYQLHLDPVAQPLDRVPGQVGNGGAADVLDAIGLTEQRAGLAGALSHGEKQWLEIGMLLMQEPELLLIDEPVAGMTPQETERTALLLRALSAEHSLIVVEHDMDFVRSIARRVCAVFETAPSPHHPGAEVLHDHIAERYQAPEYRFAIRLRQI